MALETATYINGLVATNPAGGDAIAQADDHLRLIKSTLKATFPNVTGAITATHTDLNTRLVPSGAVIMWSGAQAVIPSGWVLCDGNNSTPDLRGRFVIGAGGAYAVGANGGNASITLAESQLPSHSHSASSSSSFSGNALGGHSHTGTSDAGGAHSHTLPAYTVSPSETTTANGLYNGNYVTTTKYSTDAVGTHTHSFTTGSVSAGTPSGSVSTSTSIGATGSGAGIDIRNPYYALCYIMKV